MTLRVQADRVGAPAYIRLKVMNADGRVPAYEEQLTAKPMKSCGKALACEGRGECGAWLEPPPLYDPDEDNNDGQHEQDVDESAHCVG